MNESTSLIVPDSGDKASFVYLLLSFVLAVLLSKKTEYKYITFLLVFWILTQPIIQAFYVIRPAGLPFDFQPNRILLLVLLTILLFKPIILKTYSILPKQHNTNFTNYLIIFIFLVAISMIANSDSLDTKRLLAIPLEPVTFLLLFLVTRAIVTEKILHVLLYTIIVMSIFNALIAFYQVFVETMFLRTGVPRIAFSNTYRAYGVFPTEYIFGSFQLIALFVTLATIANKKIKYTLVAVLVVSIIVTFHRLDLLILTSLTILYLSKYTHKKYSVPAFALIGLVAITVIPAYSVIKSYSGESQLVTERLSADTVSGRFAQYWVVIKAIPKYPLGLGSYEHPKYQQLMIANKMTQSIKNPDGTNRIEGLGVHNGFLGMGIKYGILAMIVFAIILWKMFRYFYIRASSIQPLTIVPMFAIVIWILGNISNGIINFTSYNLLVISLLTGAYVGLYERGYFQNKNETNI